MLRARKLALRSAPSLRSWQRYASSSSSSPLSGSYVFSRGSTRDHLRSLSTSSASALNASAAAAASSLAAAQAQSSSASSPVSSTSSPPLNLKLGDKLHGFTVKDVSTFEDFSKLTAYKLEHAATGASYLHIACDDTNNVFQIGFRTPPENSKGTPHILEHCVLCGSEKYPVRDPFMNMIKRSLNTFMNAMTGADTTYYVFSSQNQQDYQNLQKVYSDAVFFPHLNALDFSQEGQRVEFAEHSKGGGGSSSSASKGGESRPNLEYKGVVLNEMKGAMSDSSSLFYYGMMRHLYPSTTYRHNSGGDPAHIPSLTHEEFVNFHKKHYHPSNSIFFSYGSFPLEDHLQLVNERVLERFAASAASTSGGIPAPIRFPNEAKWSNVKRVDETCPPDPLVPDPNKQTRMAVGYVCNPLSDSKTTFGMQILSSLLMDDLPSPLYKALISSNIGSGYAPYSGYSAHNHDTSFHVGLEGIAKDDIDKVERIIADTLKGASETGFPESRIEAILHRIELGAKHVSSKFGMNLAYGLTAQEVHAMPPFEPLKISESIREFRAELARGPYLQNLIKEHLINNPHKLVFTMTADPEYNTQLINAEADKLRALEKTLSEGDKERIRGDAKKLVEHQNQEQNIDVLPTLTVKDIPLEIERVDVATHTLPLSKPLSLSSSSSSSPPAAAAAAPKASPLFGASPSLFVVNQPTNGVGYTSALFDVSSQSSSVSDKLTPRLRQRLPLFAHCLTQVATEKHTAEELAELLNLRTGGISASYSIDQDYSNLDNFREHIAVSSSALRKNTLPMMSLLDEIVFSPKFSDFDRLKTLVTSFAQDFAASLQDNGTSFASSHAASHLLPGRLAMERASGIEQANFLNSLVSSMAFTEGEVTSEAKEAERKVIAELAADFAEIANILRDDGASRWKITGEEQTLAELSKHLPQRSSTASSSAAASNNSFAFSPTKDPTKTFFQFPISSNYISASMLTVPNSHEDFAKLLVLSQMMQFVYLLPEVREKGGAYGAYTSQNSGVFTFSSFRDGKCRTTLSKFAESIDKASQGDFTDTDVSQALLSTFSRLDTPISPFAKGNALFVSGITNEMRQKTRERLLAVKKDDLVEVAQKYLKRHTTTIVGGDSDSDNDNSAATLPCHVCVVGPETISPEEKPLPEDKWVYKMSQM